MTDLSHFKGAALPVQRVVVERGPVSNFATAVTDRNPVFHDARAAAEAGFDRMPTPPTWNFAMHQFGAFPELQPADAATSPVAEVIAALHAGGGMLLHGEQEFTYHRPVLVGDVLTSSGQIRDIEVKESGNTTMTVVTVETAWTDAEGAPVCASTMTLLHRRPITNP